MLALKTSSFIIASILRPTDVNACGAFYAQSVLKLVVIFFGK
jgi:hypothetical protein